MKRTFLLALSTLLLSHAFLTTGQLPTPYFEPVKLDNGLSVSSIIQDREGYIWLATFTGLLRFDGYSGKYYKAGPDSASLTDGRVRCLLEDSNQNLWVGTYSGGLNLFNKKTESFSALREDKNNPFALQSDGILSLYEDRNGDIWIGTYGGGVSVLKKEEINSNNPKLINYLHDPEDENSLSDNTVMSFLEDSSGRMWVATWNGGINLVNRDQSEYRFQRFMHDPKEKSSLSNNTTFAMIEDAKGRIWVSSWGGGLNRMIESSKGVTFLHYRHDPNNVNSLSDDVVSAIFEDSDGVFWVATYGKGLNRMVSDNPESKQQFIRYSNISGGPSGQVEEEIFCLYEDNQKNLWIGLYDLGVVKLDMKASVFGLVKDQPGNKESFASRSVTDIFEDTSGNLWVSKSGGILDLYPKGLTHTIASEVVRYRYNPNNRNSPNSNPVYDMVEDAQGRIWMSTYGGGITRITPGPEILFEHYLYDPLDSSSLSNNIALTLLYSQQGDLWIGTQDGGLNRLPPAEQDKNNPQFITYRHDPQDGASLSHNSVTSLNMDSKGNLWIGTDGGGLNKLTNKNIQQNKIEFEHYVHDDEDISTISHNVTYGSFVEDSEGNLWIGTCGGGLCKLNPKTNSFLCYDENDGLCGNIIYNVIHDDLGKLWIVTSLGVCSFDPDHETFSSIYTEHDGMQGYDYADYSSHKGNDGRLYFGGRNGFNAFFPDEISPNDFIPPVVITDFLLFNEPVNIGQELPLALGAIDEITLDYAQNVFTFEFSALNYRQVQENQFAYQLEGFNTDWIHVSAQERKAHFTNIPPGSYNFRVKASNNDAKWNENGTTIKLNILPPWWKTWWAQVLFYSCAFLVVLSIIQIRFSVIKKQKRNLELEVISRTREVQEQKNELELQAQHLAQLNSQKNRLLSIVSHDLRNPLASLQGIASMLDPEILTDKDLLSNFRIHITNQINHLGASMINLLDWAKSQMEGESIAPELIDLQKVGTNILELYANTAEKKNITLRNEVKKTTEVFADPNHVRVILRNLVGNALKFTTEKGQIILSAAQKEDEFVISVRDTGKGMTKEKQATLFTIETNESTTGTSGEQGVGLGLLLVKEFTEKNGGKIWVESAPEKGSTFYFTLPVKKI